MMNEEVREIHARINALKSLLTQTDYKAIKAAEGDPPSDWAEVKEKRKAWRSEVDALQIQLAEYEDEQAI